MNPSVPKNATTNEEGRPFGGDKITETWFATQEFSADGIGAITLTRPSIYRHTVSATPDISSNPNLPTPVAAPITPQNLAPQFAPATLMPQLSR